MDDEYLRNTWYYEWNDQVPWVENEPWLEYETWDQLPNNMIHTCQQFRFKDGRAEWPTCNWKTKNQCNGGNLPGLYSTGYWTYCESLNWYEELEDGDLKTHALMARAFLINQFEEQDSEETKFRHWLTQCFRNFNKLNHELMTHLEDYWWNQHDMETSFEDTWKYHELQHSEHDKCEEDVDGVNDTK